VAGISLGIAGTSLPPMAGLPMQHRQGRHPRGRGDGGGLNAAWRTALATPRQSRTPNAGALAPNWFDV
jgi:hypothetical protein